jgi:hypothetical protein
MDEKIENCVEWGHPLEGPNGEKLRVPLWAYKELQKLGLKKRYSTKISPLIYTFLKVPKLAPLTSNALKKRLCF